MRRRLGQALRLGVGSDGIALVLSGRRSGVTKVLAERRFDPDGLQAIAAAVRELLTHAAPAGWPLSVVLSDELVRMWLVTPPPGCSRLADLQAAAALRFQHLYGGACTEWKVCADWNVADPFLAAAVPEALLSVLEQAARERRCHLVDIVPHFVAALNRWRKQLRPGAWFGALHADTLTLAAFDGARLAALRPVIVPAGSTRQWLDGQVAREALRLGLAQPRHLLVAGGAPAGWGGSGMFACRLLDATGQPTAMSAVARLACAGSGA